MPRLREALRQSTLLIRRDFSGIGGTFELSARAVRQRSGLAVDARNLNSAFAREESAQLSKIREFSEKYLTEKHDTVLYMFSGPDFLYATSFFPNASTYILAGLEPVGSVPDLTSLSLSAVDGELRSLEASMSSLFSFSFFITHKMKTQLREGQIYGALPILYVFLARTSKTIHEVSFVRLDEQGNLQIADGWTR